MSSVGSGNSVGSLSEILSAYDAFSSSNAFVFVIYNISECRNSEVVRPGSFPLELWVEGVENAPSPFHYPVLIRGFEELQGRVHQQNEMKHKLNGTFGYVKHRAEQLVLRAERVHNSMVRLVQQRRACRSVRTGEHCAAVYSARAEMRSVCEHKQREVVQKQQVIAVLQKYRHMLEQLNQQVREEQRKRGEAERYMHLKKNTQK